MNPNELLRIVDAIHRDKNIDKSIVFDGIESALVSAAKKHYGEDQEIVITIDRNTGQIHGTHDGTELTPENDCRENRRANSQAGDDSEDSRG